MSGHLEIYVGPMCAGKTHFLFSKLATHTDLDENFKILYINSVKDVRQTSGDDFISSHHSHFKPPSETGKKVVMKKLAKLSEISDDEIETYHLIGIDEIQFFDDLVPTITHWVDDLKRRIICVGLDGTFNRDPWDSVAKLLPKAEKFKKKNAYCKECIKELGNSAPVKEAPFTYKYPDQNGDNSKNTNDVASATDPGGLDKYTPVCRKHYLQLNQGGK